MNLTKETIGSFARYLAGYLFGVITGPLVSRNVITADLSAQLQLAVEQAIGLAITSIVLFVAPLVWSWWRNVVGKAKVSIALSLDPQFSTIESVQRRSDELPVKAKLARATQERPLPEVQP